MKVQEVMISQTQPKSNAAVEDHVKKVIGENASEGWVNTKWRPLMAWQYFVVCLFDFVVGPIGWAIIQAWMHTNPFTAWIPLTLQGGGLYHLAMGAIIGVAAWTRSNEKMGTIEAINNVRDALKDVKEETTGDRDLHASQ